MEPSGRPELLLAYAAQGILGIDRQRRITRVNLAGEELLGLRETAATGACVCEWLHASDGAPLSESFEGCVVCTALRSKWEARGEVALRRKDGMELPVALYCRPIVEGGRVQGAVLVLEDITHRLRTEAALRRSEAKYRELVERAAIGIFRSTPDGELLAVNAALVAMLGYESPDALRAVNLRDIYVDPTSRLDLMERREEGPEHLSEVVRWKHRDGTELRVRLSWRTIEDDEGRVVAYEDFVQDLTKAAIREQQLRHSQKMEAIGQLTAGIAHDFNNELSVILLNSELISEAVRAEQQVASEHLASLQEAIHRAATITRQLLGFSRQADLAPEGEELGRLVQRLSGMLRTLLPETIDLVADVDEEPCPVVIDSSAVEQCILNLVGNARDAMPDGGVLRLEVRDVHVLDGHVTNGGPPEGRYVCLRVADTGTGMNDKVRSRVFDPFFTTKPKDRGTGLGLAMVYGLTHQQGGYTTVESRLGEGSSFRLWFPYAERARITAPCRSETGKARRGSETVLVVEDDAPVLTATERTLTSHGYTVLTARCAEEALAILEGARTIDLVLSDLGLPAMSGSELRDRVRSDGWRVPFILASGYPRQEAEERYGLNASEPFVQKPWSRDELLCVVRASIDRSTAA